MSETQLQIKQLAVDQPIINKPYEEPTRYWIYEDREPKLMDGRRPAGYYFRPRTRGPKTQMTLVTDEQFVEMELVNEIRHKVAQWRKDKYAGATEISKKLLKHWWDEQHEPYRLFFCQLEAVETVIWLNEIGDRSIRSKLPLDQVVDAQGLANGYKGLRRYACKMATGSGKTVVMAMIAAWTFLNHAHNPKDKRFSDAILAVCPGLTIRERLQVLKPGSPGNYYDRFNLVPMGLRELLGKGRILVTNWHDFLLRDDSKKRGVVQRGKESNVAFAQRVLHDLGGAKNILVFNDEAHHAYRPPALTDEQMADLDSEECQELEEATVWVQGLDRINATRGVNFCLDLSATPFHIGGSGHEEGTPFKWVVSDFGLVDAIESGLVKIPRVPVDDNTGQAIPKYFSLWRWINEELKKNDPASAGTGTRKPKPEAVLREADGALKQLAGLWKENFDQFAAGGQKVPPAMIVVCDNTNLSQVFYEHISGEHIEEYLDEKGKKRKRTVQGTGQVVPELLSNTEGFQPTMRIDSKLIRDAEMGEDGKSRGTVGDELRHRVSTVGKVGESGQDVRCVVSVAMLSEGWDANNVKQILGLRAFDSQLLCEQVVGRGLRRMSYTVNDEGYLEEEYVDVYGVPFEVIPVKKKPIRTGGGEEKPRTLVQAVDKREPLAIEFPMVEGYVYRVGEHIKADLAAIDPIHIDPKLEPTAVFVKAKVWAEGGPPSLIGPGEVVEQTREQFYAETRIQSVEYGLAQRILDGLLRGEQANEEDKDRFRFKARHQLFNQVLAIVREFLQTKVNYSGVDPKEIGLEKYRQLVVQRLLNAILPDEDRGEAALLPRVERFRPKGSTKDVLFSTTRPCRETLKSHVSHVVLDSLVWEGSAAFELERSPHVVSYVKNDHLGFTIPYEFNETSHSYIPDYLVRLKSGQMLIIEIKGQETERDRQKWAAARRWVAAVNNVGEWGKWELAVCKETEKLPQMLAVADASPGTPRVD